jgi:hypothetical protein
MGTTIEITTDVTFNSLMNKRKEDLANFALAVMDMNAQNTARLAALEAERTETIARAEDAEFAAAHNARRAHNLIDALRERGKFLALATAEITRLKVKLEQTEAERDTLREQVRVLQAKEAALNDVYNGLARQGCTHRGCSRDEHTMQCPIGIAEVMASAVRQAALRATAPQEADDGS